MMDSDSHDIRSFMAVEAAEPVLVRAQRFREGCKVLIIAAKTSGVYSWYKNLDDCKMVMHGWDWYLCLKGETPEAHFRIDQGSPYDFEKWFKNG